jgi:diguanylate cyclase (GGDEF)-like protein
MRLMSRADVEPCDRAANQPLPRIMVADDDRINTLIISNALKGEFEVVAAGTGIEVLDRVAAGDIDLVLLDVVMPGLDGFDVCRRLKSDPATATVPVIFVTSLEESADETKGFAVGAVDYIMKPIRPSIVRARVRTHVELKRTRDLFEKLASVDPLTGVANRRRFDTTMSQEWRRSARGGRWLSLALVDVDHFKELNDRYGHLVGDQCLRAIAMSLAGGMRRAGELVARYGGEEFGLVLPDVSSEMVPGIMRSLLEAVSAIHEHLVVAEVKEPITVSIGAISVVPTRDEDALAGLAWADGLLYEAKGGGRDRCVHLDLATQTKTTISRVVRRP